MVRGTMCVGGRRIFEMDWALETVFGADGPLLRFTHSSSLVFCPGFYDCLQSSYRFSRSTGNVVGGRRGDGVCADGGLNGSGGGAG